MPALMDACLMALNQNPEQLARDRTDAQFDTFGLVAQGKEKIDFSVAQRSSPRRGCFCRAVA